MSRALWILGIATASAAAVGVAVVASNRGSTAAPSGGTTASGPASTSGGITGPSGSTTQLPYCTGGAVPGPGQGPCIQPPGPPLP